MYLTITGKSRYDCTHMIPPSSVKERRISLTFRRLAQKPTVFSQKRADRLLLKKRKKEKEENKLENLV
jgi:hypothetical protein